jgi:hypothetical protein
MALDRGVLQRKLGIRNEALYHGALQSETRQLLPLNRFNDHTRSSGAWVRRAAGAQARGFCKQNKIPPHVFEVQDADKRLGCNVPTWEVLVGNEAVSPSEAAGDDLGHCDVQVKFDEFRVSH